MERFVVGSWLDGLRYRVRVWRKVRRARQWTATDDARLAFYKQFVEAGDVVFDVGANLGNRVKVFCRLGATVVAVEPQRFCADVLARAFGGRSDFCLARCALGAKAGEAEMYIANAHTISSLSAEWIRSVKDSGRFAEFEWGRREVVPVDTMDNLTAKFGFPSFIKIDVEGFESEVLAGLSRPARAVSFEFVPEFIGNAFRCVDRLSGLGEYAYQISIGESMDFVLPAWVSADEVKAALGEVDAEKSGDIYARLVD